MISYARPYTASRGDLKYEYRLGMRHVPTEHRDLHDRLLAARKRIFAHTDLTVKEARVHVARTATGKFVGVVQNVLSGSEEFSNLDAIVDLVEKSLTGLYAELAQLEAQLRPNA